MSDPTGRLLAVDRKFVFPSSFPFAKLTSDNEIDRRQRRGQLRANVKSSRHVHGASDPVCAECIRGGLGLGTISSHAPSLAHSFMGAQTPFCRTIPSATRTAHSTVALCWGAIMGRRLTSSKRQTREGWRCRMFRTRYLATLSTGAQHVARGSVALGRGVIYYCYTYANLLADYRNLAFSQVPSRGLSYSANCNGQYRRISRKYNAHHLCKGTAGSGGNTPNATALGTCSSLKGALSCTPENPPTTTFPRGWGGNTPNATALGTCSSLKGALSCTPETHLPPPSHAAPSTPPAGTHPHPLTGPRGVHPDPQWRP
ncbi:hypothetical protein V495_02039, partial [Pseudogymnoascus sp. VKM F-4514 (FW-929)]